MFTKEEIKQLLKNDILSLTLKPGTLLSETTLSERFQLSRTPLRDVLKQLAQEAYIDIYPKKGNVVSYIDLESVEQMSYLRSALEKEIMKELSTQFALSDIQKLSEILESQKAVIDEDHATDQFLILDDEFHHTMFQLVGREFLWQLIQHSNVHYIRYRKLHMLETGKLMEIWHEHQSMLEYMLNHETSKMDDLIHHHLRKDMHSLKFLRQFTDYIKK
ncbi:GntR family transcriptional regulator [Paenibacillus ottowii]|uniref:GntR family transcriptional regulator n=1 Tax=Paenibacillus ottowii TaxID=2315729 RepID=UPI0027307A84|nr:GntR family transcriptional regulator [Paenibacillus ottowii]MDP1513166.1 GntR family transcriptional regulator [Paenibacillus ottowii]